MGWWSTEINGGDTPMDIEGSLAEFMGLDEMSDDFDGVVASGKLTAEIVNAFLSDNDSFWIKSMHKSDDLSVLYTVLGELLMEAGAPITEEFRALIIEHAETDRWAKENPERQVVIEEFCEAMENYVDGTPTELARGAFMDRATTVGYIANPTCHDIHPPRPLADLMPKISAILITNLIAPAPAPTLWNVVGYERGRLICRCQHQELMLTADDIRDYMGSVGVDIRLFELNELRVTDA